MTEIRNSGNQYEIQDPIAQYPSPPFPQQEQTGPGDELRFEPTPDHGQDSYVGFGRLKGRRVLITGADSGIGKAVAIAFAREGADIALNFLDEELEDARDTASTIEADGRTAALVPGDISDETACQDIVQASVAALGGLDCLVMVAGYQRNEDDILDLDTAQLDRTMKTNVYSLFWLSKAVIPHLPKGGSIITTSSSQAYQPSPDKIDYAVSKGAIRNFTQGLAQQLAPKGIRVNSVAPGPFWTVLQPVGQSASDVEEFGSQSVYGRPGQPAEIAATYVFLASQESSFTSGETIAVTGGTPVH
ncbi:SDR family oxidoreductase [Clavibacter sp. VKM Ac-2873]|uniref:SDR family oxidoreductase n=1 Tax=Clavibacter sp. VKM Ac-2873 TaxID=2783813 RepID=UPI001E519B37|nr:SDR family oxidoreductase [Clavibacter sp. VKM Ac-2873]